jgi:hypothetical protein
MAHDNQLSQLGPQPGQPTSDEEAYNALQFRQPHGSQAYGQFASHVFTVLRKRGQEVSSAYGGAINVANVVFGYSSLQGGQQSAGGGEGATAAAGADSGQAGGQADSQAGQIEDEAAANAAYAADDAVVFDMRRADFTAFRVHHSAEMQAMIIMRQFNEIGGRYSDDAWPETAEAARYAVHATDDLIRELLSRPLLSGS